MFLTDNTLWDRIVDLSRVQTVQLLSVEVGGQASRLSGGQDPSSLLDVEHSLFTEDVDVVDMQLTNVQSTSDVRQLDIDDVIGRLLRRATSAQISCRLCQNCIDIQR